MDLTALLHTPELEAFRQEVRQFLRAHLPDETRRLVAEERMDLPKELQRQWHRILLQMGWVCVSWPKDQGGPGWDEARQYIFERELALADCPRPMIYGVGMLGPTLIKYGNTEQKARHLPRIRNADDFWCQGFSEPNAGSDLASLQTRAVRQGDRYIINGSKMWTSEGAIADRMFGLFRTDSSGKKQQGITFLLVDMHAKGIEVKPIRTIDGASTEINQVFFTDVEVPVEERLGEEGGGWGIAKYLLSLERFGTAEVSRSLASLKRVRDLACQDGPRGRLIDDPDFARRVAEAEVQLRAVELTELRMLFGSGGDMGAEAALLKLRGTVVQNAILELYHDAAGHAALAYSGENDLRAHRHASPAFYNYRKTMIYGGSNEIQRNIIAKAVLGLT